MPLTCRGFSFRSEEGQQNKAVSVGNSSPRSSVIHVTLRQHETERSRRRTLFRLVPGVRLPSPGPPGVDALPCEFDKGPVNKFPF